MTRAKFYSILQNLPLSNNDNDNKTDKSQKTRRVLQHLNKVFAETLLDSPFQSVYKDMFKLKGKFNVKKCIKNKLIK